MRHLVYPNEAKMYFDIPTIIALAIYNILLVIAAYKAGRGRW
jgi:hypothetical protein